MSINVTLVLPSATDTSKTSAKALNRLLSRAQHQVPSINLPAEFFLQSFGVSNKQLGGASALTAIEAAGLELAGPHPYWMRADPVQIIADQSNAFLTGIVKLSDDEITEILLDINQLLINDDCFLHAPQADAWYLNLPQMPKISTQPLADMVELPIMSGLPIGTDEVYWRRLFTEIQMLLHSHPVNEHRRRKLLPTVDGLWFWGQGSAPTELTHEWQMVWTENLVVQGLCFIADCLNEPVPASFPDCQPLMLEGNYLITLDHIKSTEKIEEAWAQPLLNALQKKEIQQLTLINDKGIFTTNTKQLKQWWRKTKSFY